MVSLFTLLFMFGLSTVSVSADDTVLIRSGSGDAERRIPGTVIDFTGEGLLMRHASGREERIPSERVIEVLGDWAANHQAANAQFAAEDFAAAERKYREALREEDRRWVQRRVLSQLTWCYRYLGQTNQAVKAFLPLYRDDPKTPYFAAIPLAWTTSQPDAELQRQAVAWMHDRNSSAARLIGASWLVSSAQRAEAMEVLRRFASDPDPRIVFLAEAQLWRTQVTTARPDDLSRWQSRVAQMPAPIRGGPNYVLGLALRRHEMHEQAALRFLRTAILYSAERDLAAESLLAAARELETMERAPQAAGLYREIVTRYGASRAASEAESRLAASDHKAPP